MYITEEIIFEQQTKGCPVVKHKEGGRKQYA